MSSPESPNFDANDKENPPLNNRAITLAVFAPLDKAMSFYPNKSALPDINSSSLVRNLLAVSEQGVHVTALIDRVENCSWQIDISPGGSIAVTQLRKIKDMTDPAHLVELVYRAMTANSSAEVILCLEGHGAGYFPDIDTGRLNEQTMASLSPNGVVRWQLPDELLTTEGHPILPMVHPLSSAIPPSNAEQPIMSTWSIGQALELVRARPDVEGRKIALIHFNNCFNMSVELLHTVAPHAHFATGYMNYNFFSAGESYPAVFAELRTMSNPRVSDLAKLFARHNQRVLAPASTDGNNENPTTGAVIALRRMPGIAGAIDEFSKHLIRALPQHVKLIQVAIEKAQQYDTGGDGSVQPERAWTLEVPDQLTDIRHFSKLISDMAKRTQSLASLAAAADTLYEALSDVKYYGEAGKPWVGNGEFWSFKDAPLAMNIFCPDPGRTGIWDWRAPYYLLRNAPQVQNAIPFLASNAWVDFIIKYHWQVPFQKYLPISVPKYPMKKGH